MSPSSSSSDGDAFGGTVDTIARRGSRDFATAASDGTRLSGSDLYLVAVDEAFAATARDVRDGPLGARVSALSDGDDVERLSAGPERGREPLASAPIELSVRPSRGASSERAVPGSASPAGPEPRESPGVARSDGVPRWPSRESPPGSEDVLNCIDDLFCVIDREGRLQRWNESVRSVTDYSDREIEAMGPLGLIAERDRERVADSVNEAFETGSSRVEASVRTKGGERVPIEFVSSAIDTHRDETMVAGVGRAISERKRRQRRLEESNERLEQFAYAASHDLQEPLRMVSSYLRLIEERYGELLDEDGEEFLEFAVDGADRMREMIDGLLAYSRIESGGDRFEPVELDDVVADVRDSLQVMCDEHRAEVTVDSLPRVEGDRSQLRQLFQNLLDNAMGNGGDAPPRIHVSAERDGERWLLSVRDEGVGIDPADAERIFEAFQSLDGPDENGSGIGLALCKRIVERHGGDIRVDSALGEGATFSFTLPAAGDDGE